ncbi:hypothetical protein CBL_09382 [Carabus blaptoides fortunei]
MVMNSRCDGRTSRRRKEKHNDVCWKWLGKAAINSTSQENNIVTKKVCRLKQRDAHGNSNEYGQEKDGLKGNDSTFYNRRWWITIVLDAYKVYNKTFRWDLALARNRNKLLHVQITPRTDLCFDTAPGPAACVNEYEANAARTTNIYAGPDTNVKTRTGTNILPALQVKAENKQLRVTVAYVLNDTCSVTRSAVI